MFSISFDISIKVITKLPNSEQSYKGKIQTHNYINMEEKSVGMTNDMENMEERQVE
jgi:hypothetical protein